MEFGSKDFKIFISLINENDIKGKVQIEFKGIKIGDFKKTDDISVSVNELYRIYKDRHDLYEEEINAFSSEEFFEFVAMGIIPKSGSMKDLKYWIMNNFMSKYPSDEELKEFNRRQKYYVSLGFQFDNYGIRCFFKNNEFSFIFNKNNERIFTRINVTEQDFHKTVKEYIEWYNNRFSE